MEVAFSNLLAPPPSPVIPSLFLPTNTLYPKVLTHSSSWGATTAGLCSAAGDQMFC